MSLRFAFFDLPSARHGAPRRSIAANRHGLRARPVTHAGTPLSPLAPFLSFFLSFLYVSRRTSTYLAYCFGIYLFSFSGLAHLSRLFFRRILLYLPPVSVPT